jgi:hypothetical protein
MAAYDGVIEAVHYSSDGQIAWVRAYERRGAAFSDYVLIDRSRLIEKLRQGKRFVLGKRIERQAGTFEISVPVRLIGQGNDAVLVCDHIQHKQDHLEGVPAI